MKSIISILLIFIVSFWSCSKNTELIYTYSPFNVPVSCIAVPPQYGDSIYYAGLENGNMLRVNFRTDDRRLISTDFVNRIYDIVQENDTTLWVGVRNNGLVKCTYKNNSITHTKVYKITVDSFYHQPTKNYAPYDIEMDEKDGTLYLGTSSGVFCLRDKGKNTDTLTLMYRPAHHMKYHFGVNQVKIYNEFLFCATDSGLIRLNKKDFSQVEYYFPNIQISHLHFDLKDSILYATSNAERYSINLKKDKWIPEALTQGSDLFAYITDTSFDKGKWEFCATQMKYSNENGNIIFPLPERMNKNYRNYICLGKDFLFFSQGKKIYSFALHQNLKGKSNHIIAATTLITSENQRICYIISNDNCLYSIIKKENYEVTPLGSIGNFSAGENILQMCSSSDKSLWFITDKKKLYTIHLKPSFEKVPFFRASKAKIDEVKDDFKSIFYDKNTNSLYVGSRYKLYRIHDPENANSQRKVDTLDIESPKEDLYVIDIGKKDNQISLVSLNHGIIRDIQKPLKPNTKDSPFFYNTKENLIAFSQSYILGDTVIYNNEKIKTISSTYYSDYKTPFFVGYQGIIKGERQTNKKLKIKDMSHIDITFNKAAIANTLDNSEEKNLLGSPSGLYEYDGNGKLEPIDIPNFQSEKLILIGFFILLLIWISGLVYDNIVLKKMDKRLKEYEGNEGKIIKFVPKEYHQELLQGTKDKDGVKSIRHDLDKIYRQKTIHKFFCWCYHVKKSKDIKKRLNELAAIIDARQIKREDIIKWNKEFLEDCRKKWEACEKRNNEKSPLKSQLVKPDQEIDTITSTQRELGKLIDIFLRRIQACENENRQLLKQQMTHCEEIEQLKGDMKIYEKEKRALESANQELTAQQDRAFGKIQSLIISLSEEIKKHIEILPGEEKEKLESLLEFNKPDSVCASLEELKKLLKQLHQKFSQYIYVDEIPSEMREKLKKIFDKNEHNDYIKILEAKGSLPKEVKEKVKAETKAKFSYIKERCISFFTDYRIYLGACEDWSSTEKSIACCYLYYGKISPFHVASEIYDEITSNTASDTRAKIHAKLDKISPRNPVLEILWNRTLSTQEVNKKKNGEKTGN